MKRLLLPPLLAFTLFFPFARATAQNVTLAVGTVQGAPPLSFLKVHKYTGFEIEIFKGLAAIMGIGFELHPMPIQELLTALDNGKIDVAIGGIDVQPESRKFDYTTPYLHTGHGLLVRADDDSIMAIEDLKGKTVAVAPVTHASFFFYDNVPEASVSVFPYPKDAYIQLESRAIDAVYHQLPTLQHYAATKGKGRVKVVGPLYEPLDFAIAVRKGSPWQARLNDALYRLKDSGKFAKLKKRWLGSILGGDKK